MSLRASPMQGSLFGGGAPAVDGSKLGALRRIVLDDSAWVDYLPGWVQGQDAVKDVLIATTAWRSESMHIYDRTLPVPRLVAGLPADGPGHPILLAIRDLLSAHYATAFTRISLGYYRDGRDSVAWHGDQVAREMREAIVATVSLGEPRRFLLRPKAGGRSQSFQLGWGDLLVMGGACQRTWQHTIPKVAHALPRVAVMFRPDWRVDRADRLEAAAQ